MYFIQDNASKKYFYSFGNDIHLSSDFMRVFETKEDALYMLIKFLLPFGGIAVNLRVKKLETPKESIGLTAQELYDLEGGLKKYIQAQPNPKLRARAREMIFIIRQTYQEM